MSYQEFPRMMYRAPADPANTQEAGGVACDIMTVENDEELEAAEDDGWVKTIGDLKGDPKLRKLLDRSAKDVMADLPLMTLDELQMLKNAESIGKNRTGLLSAIDDAVKAAEQAAETKL